MRLTLLALVFVTIWTFWTIYDALAFGWGVTALALVGYGVGTLVRHFRGTR